MRARAAVILIQDNNLALIERRRQGRHYYAFPGGKIEVDETPAQAAEREAEEELGLQVKTGRLVAEVWYLGSPQYYFLAECTSGEFGHGSGTEMNSEEASNKGSHHPIWMEVNRLMSEPVLPKLMAEFVLNALRTGWPKETLIVKDQPPDELKKE